MLQQTQCKISGNATLTKTTVFFSFSQVSKWKSLFPLAPVWNAQSVTSQQIHSLHSSTTSFHTCHRQPSDAITATSASRTTGNCCSIKTYTDTPGRFTERATARTPQEEERKAYRRHEQNCQAGRMWLCKVPRAHLTRSTVLIENSKDLRKNLPSACRREKVTQEARLVSLTPESSRNPLVHG